MNKPLGKVLWRCLLTSTLMLHGCANDEHAEADSASVGNVCIVNDTPEILLGTMDEDRTFVPLQNGDRLSFTTGPVGGLVVSLTIEMTDARGLTATKQLPVVL